VVRGVAGSRPGFSRRGGWKVPQTWRWRLAAPLADHNWCIWGGRISSRGPGAWWAWPGFGRSAVVVCGYVALCSLLTPSARCVALAAFELGLGLYAATLPLVPVNLVSSQGAFRLSDVVGATFWLASSGLGFLSRRMLAKGGSMSPTATLLRLCFFISDLWGRALVLVQVVACWVGAAVV
jgi:hypothetical protein